MQPLDKAGMGSRVKQIRRQAGLRQWQLAEMLGTTQSAVHKYEHGVVPEPRRLIELGRIGNTTVEWILTGRHSENGSEVQERPAPDVYRLAERMRAFGSQEQRTLEDALRILDEATQAMRASGVQGFEAVDLAEKERRILAAAQRVHRSVLDAVLDLTHERFEEHRPDAEPLTTRDRPQR
jgi:transcriptional regulator with XRE-family HTH domain